MDHDHESPTLQSADTSRSFIELMIREAEPLLGLQDIFAYRGHDAWGIVFDDETCFDIAYESTLHRLVVSGPIAPVPRHAQLALYESLLQYNAAWTETGGVRMALDGGDGRALMLLDLPVAQLHVGLLVEVLANMASVQRTWRGILRDLDVRPSFPLP